MNMMDYTNINDCAIFCKNNGWRLDVSLTDDTVIITTNIGRKYASKLNYVSDIGFAQCLSEFLASVIQSIKKEKMMDEYAEVFLAELYRKE